MGEMKRRECAGKRKDLLSRVRRGQIVGSREQRGNTDPRRVVIWVCEYFFFNDEKEAKRSESVFSVRFFRTHRCNSYSNRHMTPL
jgi:hypothetical protein